MAKEKSVTLDDLNHDPTLLDDLSEKDAQALYDEAESSGYPLAGTLLQDLYSKTGN